MNREQLELVTAYVDGEANPDERAAVEADAELMAEVERQRTLRDVLHDVPAPSDESREAAITAALAVFDETHTHTAPAAGSAPPSDVTTPTNIVPFEHRRRVRWMQGLGAAAAAAVVIVAGAVIATRDGDGDGTTADQQLTDATVSSEREGESAPQTSAAIVTTTVGPEIMAAVPDTDLFQANDDVAGTLAAAAAAAAEDATVAESTPDEGGEPAAPPPPAAAVPTTAAAGRVMIATEDDLAALAGTIKEPLPTADEARDGCADGQLKADATFTDGDGTQHQILVVVVDDDTLGALSLDDCEVVLEAER